MGSKKDTELAIIQNARNDAVDDEDMQRALPLIERSAQLYTELYDTEDYSFSSLKTLALKISKNEKTIYGFMDANDPNSKKDKLARHFKVNKDVSNRWLTLYGYLVKSVESKIYELQDRIEDYISVPAISIKDEKDRYLKFRDEFAELKQQADEVEELINILDGDIKRNPFNDELLRPSDGYGHDQFLHLSTTLKQRALPKALESLKKLQEDLFRHSDYQHESKSVKYLLITTLFAAFAFIISLAGLIVDLIKKPETSITLPPEQWEILDSVMHKNEELQNSPTP